MRHSAASRGDPGEFWLFLADAGRLGGLVPVYGTSGAESGTPSRDQGSTQRCIMTGQVLSLTDNQSEDSISPDPDQ